MYSGQRLLFENLEELRILKNLIIFAIIIYYAFDLNTYFRIIIIVINVYVYKYIYIYIYFSTFLKKKTYISDMICFC